MSGVVFLSCVMVGRFGGEMAWRTAHGIVAVVLVVMAIAAPIFFAVAIFVVPDLRRRFARRRMRKSQPETAEERRNAALAEPHVCGAFRLAVANGKLDDVKAITTRWTRAGMVRTAEAMRIYTHTLPPQHAPRNGRTRRAPEKMS